MATPLRAPSTREMTMRTHAGLPAVAGRVRSVVAAVASAALAFLAGFGHAATTADASLGTSGGAEATYTYDALTGAAVTLAAGRTPGQFGVTHSGAATYRIPLWTPPGVGDVELDLALVYNSRAGNGTLGHGWSLEGLSLISRCNRTVAQDGVAGGVTNTLADRFCLDGQQLKLVSGTYGAAGSVYATELESFSRVVANGVAGNGPQSFTVTTKNGLVYEYGGTGDSRIQAGASATVRTWTVSRIRDRASGSNGNSITFTYQNDAAAGAYIDGSFRIATIAYPVTATGAGPFYQVGFQYSARPASDVPVGYLAGAVIREPNQLDSITIQATGSATAIKTYNLSYATAPGSGRLRLASVQECAASSCFRPTNIGYQDGATGWQAWRDTGVSASANKTPLPLDLNGDGLTDLLYPVDAAGGNVSWRILLANLSGYDAPFDTGLVTGTSKLIPGQFVGNGRTQFLVQQNGYWYVAGYGSTGFTVTSTGLATGGEYGAADLDGDGLSDLMAQTGGLTPTIVVRRNTTVPNGSIVASFASNTQVVWTVPSTRQSMPWDNLRVADLNGDGRADIVALSFNQAERNARFFATPLLSNGFGAAFTPGTELQISQESMVTMGDWNADGCSDLIQLRKVFISNCAGGFVAVLTGAGAATGAELYTVMPADWNGDGRTDLLYVDAATYDWMVVPSTGSGAGAVVATGIHAAKTSVWFVHDADGDGLADLGFRDGNSGNKLRYRLHAAPAAAHDLATSFTDGFGMSQGPSYVSIARSHHTRRSDAVFPDVDFQAPLYVVSGFSATDGIGGTYRNDFQYFGARRHLQGRGFGGFESQRISDSRTGLVTVDYAERAFPYTGMHVQRSVFQADGTTSVALWKATPSKQVSGGAGYEQRVLPLVVSTLDRRYELGGPQNGALTSEIGNSFTFGDGYGNPTRVQTTVTDKDPNSPFFNTSWLSTATYGYSNDASTNWCLGLPAASTVTQTAPGQPAMTRTATYAVDSVACRVREQVFEPGSSTLKVTATYGFDACGNLNSLRIVGANPDGTAMVPRTTTFGYGARCQLPETVTNALGQRTTYAYRYDFGVPTRATDPNGLSTHWIYDEFGRRTRETLPDQTWTTWSFESCATGPCWGVNDLRFLVYETRMGADGAHVSSRHLFYDGFEHLRYDQYHRALGTWTIELYKYDALGRRVEQWRPYSSVRTGSTSVGFDALGRLTAQRIYDGAGALIRSQSFAYAGRTTTINDSFGRVRSTVRDVTGRTRRVSDPAPGGTTRYDYDSLGNLARIQDAAGAVSSGTYNARGFRTQWADADAGTWTYSANSLGELVAWADAKNQSFGASYDPLGRMVSRNEPEGECRWKWGGSATLRNIGRLESKTSPGYGEAYEYDAAGRLSARIITSDQTYRYDYTYNSIGALATLTYPSSPTPSGQTGPRLAIKYGYSYGAVARIEDVTGPQARLLWTLDAANDDGVPTAESIANGTVALASAFDPATGLLTSRQAGAGGNPTNRQNLAFQWNAAGNLMQRRDANQGLTEAFSYDPLDRVTGSSLNGAWTLTVGYDAAGNLTQKSDVGSYTYGNAARPHAVTAAGAETLGYDANGNVVTRNGLAQQWASFNLPTLVQKAGQQSQFAYGPDHQRWRQVASYANGTETTHYVGALLEKESTTSTGRTYWRHYVPTPGGATVVVSRNSDGSTATNYLLTDHLGSTDTVLDVNGAVVSKQSFGPFGTRRGGNWSSATAPDWAGIANTTRQGYTGHEMIDNVGLVHMGGRVYDPTLGRFLSVDPIVGDLGDSQSVNPYAYVGNRPLRDVDPTGYDVVCGGVCMTVVASIVKSALNFLGGDNVILPQATAIPGQSAQSGVGLCGPGTFSPTCGGRILYAGVPSMGEGGPGTSTWTIEQAQYETENLEQFFMDLGINAIHELLSPIYDGAAAYDAWKRGEHVNASVSSVQTICDIGKVCAGVRHIGKGVKVIASTGGVKRRFVQAAEQVYYRVFSTNSRGKWVTSRPPKNSEFAQETLSLPPGNKAEYVQEVRVPAGTRMERSRASPVPEWNRHRGGGEQFEILDEIPPGNFGQGQPLE
jgi:RHS repeat-associated protein